MERVRAVAPLNCPAEEAEGLLPSYVASHRSADGTVRMPLRVPLGDFGLPGNLVLSRDVEICIEKRRDEENLNDEFAVAWKPCDGQAFPELHGRLTVWSEGDPEQSYVEIDGTYEPPLGEVGEAFDAAIGHLIAQRTATAFVHDLGDGLLAMRTARTR